MKTVLILIDSLAYLGATISIYKFRRQLEATDYLAMIFVVVLNSVCAYYLYKKAQQNKAEWALLGFAGNLTSLFIFWIWGYVVSKWEKGEKVIKSGYGCQQDHDSQSKRAD